MPRPDNKRAKQGRPTDPRTTVFQEAFTPNMPSAQQNVFIKPGPEIIDQPSKTSYGNMVPGPSGELEVLKGIVGGFNKGVDAYNRVHQDRVKRDREKADKIFNQEYVKVTLADGSTDMVKKGGRQHTKYLEEQKVDPDTITSMTDGTDVSSFEHKRERLQGLLGGMTREGRQYTKTKLNSAGKVHQRNLDQQAANQLRIDLAGAKTETEREAVLDAAETNGYVENGDEWTMIQVERAKIATRQADAAESMALSEFEKDWRMAYNEMDVADSRALGRDFITDRIIDSGVFDDILKVKEFDAKGNKKDEKDIKAARELAYDSAVDLQAKIENMADDFEVKQSELQRQHREYLEKANDEEFYANWDGMDTAKKLKNLSSWETRLKTTKTRQGLEFDEDALRVEKTKLLKEMLDDLSSDDTGSLLLRLADDLGIDGATNFNGRDLAELVTRRLGDALGLTEQLENDNVHTQSAFNSAEDAFVSDIATQQDRLRTFVLSRGSMNLYEQAAIQEEIVGLDTRKDLYQKADEAGKIKILTDLNFLGPPTDLDGEIGRTLDGPEWQDLYEGMAQAQAQSYEANFTARINENIKDVTLDPTKPLLTYEDWLSDTDYRVSYIDSRLTSLDGNTDFLVEFVETTDPEARVKLLAEALEGKGNRPETIRALTEKMSQQLGDEQRKFGQLSSSASSDLMRRQAAARAALENQSLREKAVAALNKNGLDISSVTQLPKDTDHSGKVNREAYRLVSTDAYVNGWNALSSRALPSALYDSTTPGGQILNTLISDEGFRPALEALREGDVAAIGEWITGLEEDGKLQQQDTQAVGEILQILDYSTYSGAGGFTVRRYDTPIAMKLQASMLAQVVNLEGKTYTIDDPNLVGTPQEFKFKITEAANFKENITAQIFDAFGELTEGGENERQITLFYRELIEDMYIAKELEAIGTSVDDENERNQRMLAIDSGLFLRSPEFVQAAQEFGLTADFAKTIQLTGMIFGGNFDETTLASLPPESQKLVRDALDYFLSPNNGSVFSEQPGYVGAEKSFRRYFQGVMSDIREQGAKISYADQLRVLYKYATGTGINADYILNNRIQTPKESFSDEQIVDILQRYVPADMAERRDAEEMSEFVFRAINDNQTLDGINAFTIMNVLNRQNAEERPFVLGELDPEALFFMALKPYELPFDMRYESMLGPVTGFMPRPFTRKAEFGGNIVFSAEDALFASSIQKQSAAPFVRSYVQQHQHHDQFGGLTGEQLTQAEEMATILAEQISNRDQFGHPTDLLTATVASEMILAQVSGRASDMLTNLMAGAPADITPTDYLDFAGIGQLIYTASAYGDTTAEENMAFRLRDGTRFASVPNINPFGEISPNQQYITIGGKTRVLTLGDMQEGSLGGSYIYDNPQSLPNQLAEVSHLVRDTKRRPSENPLLSTNRYGFSVLLADMSLEDQNEVLTRLEDNQNNMILDSLADFGYITINDKTGIIDIKDDAVPASTLQDAGISIGNIDPNHLVSIDVALEMVQQPLELKKRYLEYLMAGNQGADMSAFMQQKGMTSLAGLPRRVSLGEEKVDSRLGTTRTQFGDFVDPVTGQRTQRTYRLPYEYQPIQTISQFDPTYQLDEKGQIIPETYVEGGDREGYGYGGASRRKLLGLVRTATANIGNFFTDGDSYDAALERGRAAMRQQPTRYLRDASKYDVTVANLLNIRYKKVDANGNPLQRPGVSSPFRSPAQRMGIEEFEVDEELRRQLEEQQTQVIPEGIG